MTHSPMLSSSHQPEGESTSVLVPPLHKG